MIAVDSDKKDLKVPYKIMDYTWIPYGTTLEEYTGVAPLVRGMKENNQIYFPNAVGSWFTGYHSDTTPPTYVSSLYSPRICGQGLTTGEHPDGAIGWCRWNLDQHQVGIFNPPDGSYNMSVSNLGRIDDNLYGTRIGMYQNAMEDSSHRLSRATTSVLNDETAIMTGFDPGTIEWSFWACYSLELKNNPGQSFLPVGVDIQMGSSHNITRIAEGEYLQWHFQTSEGSHIKRFIMVKKSGTFNPGSSVGFYPPALVVRSKVTDATAPIWYGEIAIQGCGWTIWNNNL